MANDSTQAVRRAAMTRLRAVADVTAIVGDQVFGQVAAAPAWPFIKTGAPSLVPRRASCLDGAEVTLAIHGFARERKVGKKAIETAEDHASRLGAAIAKGLDGYSAEIPGGYARFQWTGSQLLVDGGEADAFHTVQNFRIRCVTNNG